MRGRRRIGLAALASLDLDEVWWLVSPQNPLKPADGMARFADRMPGLTRQSTVQRI
jgi:nicotinate-nucleotide adenylyltransferase